MMRRLMFVALVGALMATPAAAHQETVLDEADTAGPLDIVAARDWDRKFTIVSTHPQSSKRIREFVLKLVTYEPWENTAITGGKNFISFEFNLDEDDTIERCIVVRAHTEPDGAPGRPEATVYRGCNYFDDRSIRDAGRVSRQDEHSLRVTILKRKFLPRGVRSFAWRAVTSYEEQPQSSECAAPEPHGDGGYGTCADFTSWQRHRL